MMAILVIQCLTFSACNESGEEIHRVPAAPGDTIITNTNTTYKVGAEMLDTVSHSGWLKGDAQLKGQGWLETLVSTTGAEDQVNRTTIGGRYVSEGVLTKDTIFCGTSFPEEVSFWVTDVKSEDVNTTDSIGAKVEQSIAGSDGQTGSLVDFYRHLKVVLSSGGTVPHYEGISKIIGVKYEVETDTTRRVYLLVESSIRPKGTTNAPIFDMYYSAWYMQKIRKEVVPPEPEVEKMDWSVVFELKENSVAKTLQATFNFTGTKGTTFSWKSNTGKVGFYASPNPFYVESVNPLPQEGNGADYEASLAKDKTTDKEIVMVTSHERCLLSKWKTTFRTGIADGEVFLRNDVNFYVTSIEFAFNNGETFRFDFEPETVLHDDQFITENGLTQTLTGSDGKTYKYGKTLVQSATHKIRGTVTTPDGKTAPIVIEVLSDGETLYYNEGKVALYVMQ